MQHPDHQSGFNFQAQRAEPQWLLSQVIQDCHQSVGHYDPAQEAEAAAVRPTHSDSATPWQHNQNQTVGTRSPSPDSSIGSFNLSGQTSVRQSRLNWHQRRRQRLHCQHTASKPRPDRQTTGSLRLQVTECSAHGCRSANIFQASCQSDNHCCPAPAASAAMARAAVPMAAAVQTFSGQLSVRQSRLPCTSGVGNNGKANTQPPHYATTAQTKVTRLACQH